MNMKLKNLVRIAILAAVSAVLALIPGIPIIPPIYKLDFSLLPVLLAGFAMGPVAGTLVALIKGVISLITSSSMGVGELADFLMGAAMMVPAALIYRKHRTFKGALWSLLTGVLCATVAGALCNWLILIPFYQAAFHMPAEAIVEMIAKVVPAVDSMLTLILFATVPFNLLKGVVLSLLTLLLYKRLSFLLKDAK